MKTLVLWEDRSLGPVHRFGPHVFLVACVAERLEVDPYELKRSEELDGLACAGNSNVLRALANGNLWNRAPHVVAVLDVDKLHDLLKLTGDDAFRLVRPERRAEWHRDRVAQVRRHADQRGSELLSVCFLDQNLESLLELLEGGVVEKNVVARDRILQRAAADPELIHKAMDGMPTWAALVETIAARLRPA